MFRQPRNSPYVNQEITPKRPPGWDPAHNAHYPIEKWYKEMTHWIMATDVPQERRGALVVLQLGGQAREIAETIPLANLRNGGPMAVQPGQPPVAVDGVLFLMMTLLQKFQALTIETAIRAMTAYQTF